MKARIALFALLTITAIVGLSIVSGLLWGEKPEEIDFPPIVVESPSTLVVDFISQNDLPETVVLEALKITPAQAATITIGEIGLSEQEVVDRVTIGLIQYQERLSKNWGKILVKFILWLTLLAIPLVLLIKHKTSPRIRLFSAAAGTLLFGVVLGADPSPMGTVKDAVFLLTAHQTVFMPRIVALVVFLATVVLANKFICSWGCQFGLLQELLFRFGRNAKDRRGTVRQIKPPFWLSNGVRGAVFVLAVIFGLIWAFDPIGEIDPFKIFSPLHLTITGGVFLAIILAASLFVYRPWCHFACPFGLVSWFFEKLAIFRIKVDYNACTRCNVCSISCPSTVMDAILKEKRTVPDCFSCGTCIESCPTGAVAYRASREDTGRWTDRADKASDHSAATGG